MHTQPTAGGLGAKDDWNPILFLLSTRRPILLFSPDNNRRRMPRRFSPRLGRNHPIQDEGCVGCLHVERTCVCASGRARCMHAPQAVLAQAVYARGACLHAENAPCTAISDAIAAGSAFSRGHRWTGCYNDNNDTQISSVLAVRVHAPGSCMAYAMG